MFRYKIDVLQKLSDAGWNTYRIRKEKLISEPAVQKIRKGQMVGISTLDAICSALNCQPGDVIEHVSETKKEGR